MGDAMPRRRLAAISLTAALALTAVGLGSAQGTTDWNHPAGVKSCNYGYYVYNSLWAGGSYHIHRQYQGTTVKSRTYSGLPTSVNSWTEWGYGYRSITDAMVGWDHNYSFLYSDTYCGG